jgi:ABC-2 type transport system ATP-binding protein
MASHILGEVSRLARRIGIIHKGRLLQELDVEELERNRQRRLVLRARDLAAARAALSAAGLVPEFIPDGSIALENTAAITRPDDIATLLVQAGTPPTQLLVDEEDLEHYFLRLVGLNGEKQNG